MNKKSLYQIKRAAYNVTYNIFRGILLFGLCFLILQPLFDKLSVSFMEHKDLYDATVISIPRNFSTSFYSIAVNLMDYLPSIFQTVIILVISSLLQITACTLAAYGFARFKFPGRSILFICVMLVIIIPPQVVLSSLYLNLRFFDIFGLVKLISGTNINMLGSVAGFMTLSATAMGLKSGLYIFLLRQYFRGMPKELEEAAYIDGCSRLYTFGRIMLPDAAPMLTSCFLFSFVWQWTDGLFTSLFLRSYKMMSIALSSLNGKIYSYWAQINGSGSGSGNIMAQPPLAYQQAIVATGMLLFIAPLIIIYLAAQKSFVESLAQTGIKM